MPRLTLYTPELANELLQRLSGGEPLAEICRDPHMPATRTVSDWRAARPDFDAAFLKARDAGFDEIAADCLRIADTPQEGETVTSKEWGDEVKRGDMFDHRKLRIETRLKLLAKWDPRRYGERIQQDIKGELTVTSMAQRMRQRKAPPASGVDDLL